MAIEDAYVLSNLIHSCSLPSDLVKAFDAYDFVRVPRALKVTSMSREQGERLDMQSASAGDDLEKIAKDLNTKVRWIWDEDLEAHLGEALKKFEELRTS